MKLIGATDLKTGGCVPPPEKLGAQMTVNVRLHFFQFLRSLLRFASGWSANHTQRTRRERRGCRWNNRSAAPLRGCYRCVPCADGTKTKLHRSADAGSLPSSSEDYDSPRSLGRWATPHAHRNTVTTTEKI